VAQAQRQRVSLGATGIGTGGQADGGGGTALAEERGRPCVADSGQRRSGKGAGDAMRKGDSGPVSPIGANGVRGRRPAARRGKGTVAVRRGGGAWRCWRRRGVPAWVEHGLHKVRAVGLGLLTACFGPLHSQLYNSVPTLYR
jgi:hypothetical protein